MQHFGIFIFKIGPQEGTQTQFLRFAIFADIKS